MQSSLLRSPITDAHVRAVLDRLIATYRRPVGGSPIHNPDMSRDPHDYAEYGFSIYPEQGDLIYLLCRGMRATRVVDFATSIGMSTLYFAAAVRDNGGGTGFWSELLTGKIATARRNLGDAGPSHYAHIKGRDPRQEPPRLGGPVGFFLTDW